MTYDLMAIQTHLKGRGFNVQINGQYDLATKNAIDFIRMSAGVPLPVIVDDQTLDQATIDAIYAYGLPWFKKVPLPILVGAGVVGLVFVLRVIR